MRDDQSGIRSRILTQLAEVAVQAHRDGDEHAVDQVVQYLVDEPADLARVFSLALDLAHQEAGAAGSQATSAARANNRPEEGRGTSPDDPK